jgi:hypothetical protein
MVTFSQAEWIVGLWMLPTILFIVLPLTILVASGIVKLFRKAGEKGRALQGHQRETTHESAQKMMEPSAVN